MLSLRTVWEARQLMLNDRKAEEGEEDAEDLLQAARIDTMTNGFHLLERNCQVRLKTYAIEFADSLELLTVLKESAPVLAKLIREYNERNIDRRERVAAADQQQRARDGELCVASNWPACSFCYIFDQLQGVTKFTNTPAKPNGCCAGRVVKPRPEPIRRLKSSKRRQP